MSTTRVNVEQYKAMARPRKKRTNKREYLARYAATPQRTEQTTADREKQRSLFERHDVVAYSFRVPLAPSVNNYRAIFAPGGRHPRLITSAAGRAYHEAVAQAWTAHHRGWAPEALTGRLRLLVEVVFPTRAASDLDNRIKPLQDALKGATVFLDDAQIDDLRVVRGKVEAPGWMDIVIETIL